MPVEKVPIILICKYFSAINYIAHSILIFRWLFSNCHSKSHIVDLMEILSPLYWFTIIKCSDSFTQSINWIILCLKVNELHLFDRCTLISLSSLSISLLFLKNIKAIEFIPHHNSYRIDKCVVLWELKFNLE